MRSVPFAIVDVFTRARFAGNPVAVVLSSDLDEGAMAAIARWNGMPETVFLARSRPADADYAIRIFSPLRELAFAGHPSIGACHLLLERGWVRPRGGKVVQGCPAGLVTMQVDGDGVERLVSFVVPAGPVTPLSDEEATSVAVVLGAAPSASYLAVAGARWVTASYDQATLDALDPDQRALFRLSERLDVLGVSAFAPSSDPCARFEVRSFAPRLGVAEDAVCGGGNACVAATVSHRTGGVPDSASHLALQGRHMGRRGYVQCRGPIDGHLAVGGHAVTTSSGLYHLDAT